MHRHYCKIVHKNASAYLTYTGIMIWQNLILFNKTNWNYITYYSTELFHNLNEMKHFIGTFIGCLIRNLFCWLKMLAPELVNLKSALIYIKMDVALVKIRRTGFPDFCFRMQSFGEFLPCCLMNL